jgi:hypothetical protein
LSVGLKGINEGEVQSTFSIYTTSAIGMVVEVVEAVVLELLTQGL